MATWNPKDEPPQLKAGDKLVLDFGKIFSGEFFTVNGETFPAPVDRVTLDLDVARDGRMARFTIGGGIFRGVGGETQRWTQRGYFLPENMHAEFEAWRESREHHDADAHKFITSKEGRAAIRLAAK